MHPPLYTLHECPMLSTSYQSHPPLLLQEHGYQKAALLWLPLDCSRFPLLDWLILADDFEVRPLVLQSRLLPFQHPPTGFSIPCT